LAKEHTVKQPQASPNRFPFSTESLLASFIRTKAARMTMGRVCSRRGSQSKDRIVVRGTSALYCSSKTPKQAGAQRTDCARPWTPDSPRMTVAATAEQKANKQAPSDRTVQDQGHQTRRKSQPQPSLSKPNRRPAKEPCKDKNTRLATNPSHSRTQGKQAGVQRKNHARTKTPDSPQIPATGDLQESKQSSGEGTMQGQDTRLATNGRHSQTKGSKAGP